jgi:hypothetical protein
MLKQIFKLGVVAHEEAGGLWVQGQPGLQSKLKVSLSYLVRLLFQKTKG